MAIRTPGDLFQYQLSTALFCARRILHLLPAIDQYTGNPQVKQLIGSHMAEIERQVTRLEECFRLAGITPMEVPPHALDGFQGEFQMFSQQDPSQEMMDLYALDLISQIDHFEIATYRSLLDKATAMGESSCLAPIAESLNDADRTVSQVHQLSPRIGVDVIQRVPPQ